MDFQRNLPLPNISTNDVYYKRQLSFYTFNIHQLSDCRSVFYAYTEVIGSKGANEVISFLHHYVTQILDKNVKDLEIFCDSCPGQNKNYAVLITIPSLPSTHHWSQNKNYAVLLYLHYLVHTIRRLDSVNVTFPIRGHSYMECDKNMGLVKTKTVVELPSEWITVFETARINPCPFQVINVEQEMI